MERLKETVSITTERVDDIPLLLAHRQRSQGMVKNARSCLESSYTNAGSRGYPPGKIQGGEDA